MSGCASDPGVEKGVHIGISEFYVEKNAKLTFTMIHSWGENIAVRPRSVTIIEEGGQFISNYVCMEKVKDVQMYPTTKLRRRRCGTLKFYFSGTGGFAS
ncbi:MAG: SufD family Fe-S cluster assembly protein [Phascolarctobacterium faecium]